MGTAPPHRAPEKPPPRREPRPFRVLLLDAHEPSRAFQTAVIRRMGYEVTALSDPLEALNALDQAPFDLMVTEVRFADMACPELVRQVRVRSPGLPLVAVTAQAMRGDRERILCDGLDGYLSKPCSVEDLKATVQRWHDSRPAAEVVP